MSNQIEEERVLYERMKDGDDNARNQLILNAEYLVHYFAYKYGNNDRNLTDELTSEGYLALVKSIDRWEFRGKQFKIYASECIKCTMFRYFERKIDIIFKVDNRRIDSLDDVDSMLDNSLSLSYEDPDYDGVDYEKIFDKVCKVLTKTQKTVLTLFYKNGLTPTEIGKEMNKSQTAINTHLYDARLRIKKRFTKENLHID